MKTRQYESVLIVNAALEDPQIESTLGRVREIISSYGGEINDLETWGRKRLSYPIRKAKTGYYVIFRYTAPGDAVGKIERMFRLDEAVYRFLTVTLDKAALLNIEKKKTDKENKLREEQIARQEREKAEAEAAAAAEVETTSEEEAETADSETAPESNDDETN
ncbi:MAG: 30S ribosomal protein S6 [Chlorobi bacterium]|nr:30S ribosomal protein S6 [Chlorobiota bacterium]